MAYYFTPPTEEYGPAGGGRLFIRYRLKRGITVMKTGTHWEEIRFPTEDQTRAADWVFTGGYKNPITDEQRTALIAQGYGSYITSE